MDSLTAGGWSRRLLLLCLLLLLTSLVGHFVADVAGFTGDTLLCAALHGGFIIQRQISSLSAILVLMVFLLLYLGPSNWTHAPPTPPPILIG